MPKKNGNGNEAAQAVETRPLTLAERLVEVMAAVDHVEKGGRNKEQSYDYVKASDLTHAFRNELASRNVLMLASVQSLTPFTVQGKNRELSGVHILVEYTFIAADTGETLKFTGAGSGVDTGDKAIYKAHTGALKYALRTSFLVPDEAADPEADETVDRETSNVTGIRSSRAAKAEPESCAQEVENAINNGQRTRLFAIARAAAPDAGEEEIQANIKAVLSKHGMTSTKQITKDKYDEICAAIGGKKLKVASAREQ